MNIHVTQPSLFVVLAQLASLPSLPLLLPCLAGKWVPWVNKLHALSAMAQCLDRDLPFATANHPSPVAHSVVLRTASPFSSPFTSCLGCLVSLVYHSSQPVFLFPFWHVIILLADVYER